MRQQLFALYALETKGTLIPSFEKIATQDSLF